MKKYLAIICAAMLCVCCLALAACGGGNGSASGSGSASASSSSATVADQAVGDWKLAAAETQGITVAGDFSALLGTSDSMTLTINKDGTGSMVYGSQSGDFTWEASDKSITMKPVKQESSSGSASASASSTTGAGGIFDTTSSDGSAQTLEATIEDGALIIAVDKDGQKISMIFTPDGTYDKAVVIDMNKATDITSEADLVGTWNLTGLNMMGITMYGSPSDLAQAMGSNADMSLTFEQGGKGNMGGSEFTWTADSKGAAITVSGQSLPLKKLGDNIVMDFTAAYGMEMVMAFAK